MTRLPHRLAAFLTAAAAMLVVTFGLTTIPGQPTSPTLVADISTTPLEPVCDHCLTMQDAICWEHDPWICHVPITLSRPMDVEVTVSFGTRDGTAGSPTDYVGVEKETVVIRAGATYGEAKIRIVPNPTLERGRTFYVILFDPSRGVIVRDEVAAVTLTPSS
jgi:hypothetical protein